MRRKPILLALIFSTFFALNLPGASSAPPTLVAPVLSVSVTGTEASLTWTDAGGETSYHVMRLPPDGVTWIEVATPRADTLQYRDSGLFPSTTYHYVVVATRGWKQMNSNAVQVTTGVGPSPSSSPSPSPSPTSSPGPSPSPSPSPNPSPMYSPSPSPSPSPSVSPSPSSSPPSGGPTVPTAGTPTPWRYFPYPCAGVAVTPGDDLQGLIDAHPAGTTFCFSPGTYRLTQPLDPKSNDIFVGAPSTDGGPGTVLNGSNVVRNWVQSGNYWYATGQTQQTIESADPGFRCEGAYTGCTYDDDLYINNQSLWQVMSKAELVPGTFYFDYAADTIWIADNPTGRLVEATVARRALIGSGQYAPVSSVQFKGFLVEKFSTPAQVAAVTITSGGLVEGNEIRFVHGIGVTANGSGGWVLRNYIHHNGQMGISSTGGAYVLWQGNEIARNNTAGYNSGWEGGGGKFSGAIGNVFDRNYSHDNGLNRVNGGGPGIWEDGGSIGNIFSNNYISNNASDGIALEISYDTQVFGNTIVGNGTCGGCGWGAGVLIANTRNVEAYGNYIDSNRKGVLFYNVNRGSGKYGVYEVRDGYVHDNLIRMPLVASDTNPYSGFKFSSDSSLFSSSNVRFANNTYYLIAPSAKQFAWNGEQRATEAWMSLGQDTLSTYHSL